MCKIIIKNRVSAANLATAKNVVKQENKSHQSSYIITKNKKKMKKIITISSTVITTTQWMHHYSSYWPQIVVQIARILPVCSTRLLVLLLLLLCGYKLAEKWIFLNCDSEAVVAITSTRRFSIYFNLTVSAEDRYAGRTQASMRGRKGGRKTWQEIITIIMCKNIWIMTAARATKLPAPPNASSFACQYICILK